ncbi:MAG: ABC transporter ATP-binding protein [Propionibacteriaceae bacterium]|nr:ABC transporter ATP-binding protein [Propionibacteriaceae bacterium]
MTDVSPAQPLLRVSGLQTRYGEHVYPVRGVSFDLHRGESLGIVGESGSGKSVLLRSIIGVHPRTSTPTVTGSVRFEDEDLLTASPARRQELLGRRIGVIHQDPLTSLNPLKRTRDQVLESPRYHGQKASKADWQTRAHDVLKSVGFPQPQDVLHKYPHEMSGGQRQRIGIAAAVVENPTLLFADEPTTALDVTVQAQVLDLLERLRAEQGSALVLVTHDLAIVARRCDRIAVMYGGRIVEIAPADQLTTEPLHPYTSGLLQARPALRGPKAQRLVAIPGTAVPPSRPLSEGCSFASRCPLADDRCRTQLPELTTPSPGSDCQVACWKPGEQPKFSATPSQARGDDND